MTCKEVLSQCLRQFFVTHDVAGFLSFLTEDVIWMGLSNTADSSGKEAVGVAVRKLLNDDARGCSYRIQQLREISSTTVFALLCVQPKAPEVPEFSVFVSAAFRLDGSQPRICAVHTSLSASNASFRDVMSPVSASDFCPPSAPCGTALQQKKLELEALVSNLPGGVVVFELVPNCAARLTYCSDWVYDYVGKPHTALPVDCLVADFLSLDSADLTHWNLCVQNALQNDTPVDVILHIRHADGAYRFVNLRASVLHRCAKSTVMHGVVFDVNARICAQQELADAKLRNENIINSIPGGVAIYRVGEQLEAVYFSEGMPALLGYTAEEYRAHIVPNAALSVFPQDAAAIAPKLRKACDSDCAANLVFRMLHSTGRPVWVQAYAKKIGSDNGLPLLQCIFHNITQQKENEQALKESEFLYKLAAESSNSLIYKYDIKSRTVYPDANAQALHGVFQNALTNLPESVIGQGVIRPDSVSAFRALFERINAGEAHGSADIWFKAMGRSGWFCERITFTNVKDADGKVILTAGIGRNITREIDAQATQQKIEMALSHSDVLIWEYDIENKLSIQQPKCVEFLGLPPVLEHFPESTVEQGFVCEESKRDFLSLHRVILNGAKRANADIYMRTASGEKVWYHMNYHTIFNDAGKPVRAVGCATNITPLKQKADKLKREIDYQEAAEAENLLAKLRVNITQNIVERYVARREVSVAYDGMPYDITVEALAKTATVPEHQNKLRQLFQRKRILEAFQQGETHFEYEYQCKDSRGVIRWVRTTAKTYPSPETDDAMSFLYTYDIDAEKQMQMVISCLLDVDYEMIRLVELPTGRIHIPKSSAQRDLSILQYEGRLYNETQPSFLGSIVLEESLEAALDALSLARIQKELECRSPYMCVFPTKATERFRAGYRLWKACYLDASKSVLLLTRTDYTEIYEAEQNQKEILLHALADAKQASVAKTNFLSRMSHEIRTPMNAIIGMSALAAQCIQSPEQVSDCISKIGISARFLLSLINDILDMSRIESGKVVIKNEPIVFDEFIAGINTIALAQAKAKGVDYDCILSSFFEPVYRGDAMKLQQVLVNIIGNAIKFTPAGGKVRFSIAQEFGETDKVQMRFVINDTGIGIPESFLPRLFDPFEQAENGITASYGGTGLGLAICQNLVNMMHGTITVNSIVDVGSEFIVQLPLALCENRVQAAYPYVGPKLETLTALIVDDEVLICRQTQDTLLDMGMRADWVDSGSKAVETVRHKLDKKEHYDIILVDWKMPEMDGIETTRRIRKLVGPDVTIIIMTAYDWNLIEAEAKAAGVNLLVAKPLFRSSLVSSFEKVYASREYSVPSSKPVEYDFTGKRILLVEDNLLNIEVARRLLVSQGFSVDVAENGVAALESFAAAAPGYFNAVLMDIRMPVMDGLTATKSIRQMKKADAKSIPIIAMSANAFDEDVEKSIAAGMSAHLSKPIDPPHLFATLKRYLNSSEELSDSE